MERLRSELGLMAYLAVCFVSLASPTWAAAETSKVRVVGTYTNLRYSTGSGDLGGVEIKIVPARGRGFQGALQIAEGAPSELMVVDVLVEKNKISFRIPNSYPIYGGGKLILFFSTRTDRKSTRLNSSHLVISYAVFCLKKKKKYI